MTLRNENLWGEIEREGLKWSDLSSNTWGDFGILNSTIDCSTQIDVNAVNVEVFKALIEEVTNLTVHGVNVEFSPSIISTKATMQVSFLISKTDYKNNMLGSMPTYYKKSDVIDNILNSMTKQFKVFEFATNEAEDSLYIDTVTDNIDRWENELGIPVNTNKTYDFRREKVIAKLRASGTTTKQMIANVASAFSNGEVEVIEDNANYKFTVKFSGIKGIPANMDDLTEIINEIKPAHLAFEYDYTYNTWGFVATKTWGQVANITWADLQTFS